MNELEHCPFCGIPLEPKYNLTISREDIDDHWYVRNWVVKCDGCGARGGKHKSKEKAIEAWNTRHERTCRIDDSGYCDCGHPLGDWTTWRMDDRRAFLYERANYCPNCGARVKEEADAD